MTLSFWNGVHWHRFIYVEHVFVKPHKIRFLPQDDNVWQPKDRRSRKMHPPLELYFKQFSLPKGDCRRCMANNLMFSTCTHAGLNWFRLLTEGQDKPLHWCGNVASWTVNMSIYCETQSHSVHWLSSPIFPCSSPWSLLLVMLLVKLTISVNKMHFRGVRGVTFCDILAQTCP